LRREQKIRGAHILNNTDQPSLEHQVEKFDEVQKLDTIVLSMDQNKTILFAILITPLDFIISNKFMIWWNKKLLYS
jgi:hypothetical protein